MKQLKYLIVMLLVVLLLAFTTAPQVFAAEITTEPPTTTTEEQEATTTVIEDVPIIIGEDEIVIGDFTLSKEEAIAFLADILEVYLGDTLKALGIPAVMAAALLVGLLIFGLKKLTDYIKELRETKTTNSGISSTNTQIKNEIQTLAETNAKAEARAAKAETMNAVILDALVTITANSSNEAIAAYGAHLKTAAEQSLALSDKVDESAIKSIFKTATENVAKQVIGNVTKQAQEKKEALIENAKAQKAKLMASLNELSKTPTNEG